MHEKIDTAEVCENIRRLRTINNYKAEEIAKQLGISKSAYSELENNKTEITLSRLQKLADVFNVSYNFILNAKASNYQHFVNSPNAGGNHNTNHHTESPGEQFVSQLFEKMLATIDKIGEKL